MYALFCDSNLKVKLCLLHILSIEITLALVFLLLCKEPVDILGHYNINKTDKLLALKNQIIAGI